MQSNGKTDKTWLEAQVSGEKKGYAFRALHFLTSKFIYFLAKRLTTLFYDFARTMSVSLLKNTN